MLRDKAAAVKEYARMSNDYDLEIQASRARVRAERRCGQLLKEMDKAKGNQHINSAKSNGSTEQNPTLSEMGLTKNQSSAIKKPPPEHETNGGKLGIAKLEKQPTSENGHGVSPNYSAQIMQLQTL